MKTRIAKFLIHLLSYLVPVEDAIHHVLAKAAKTKLVQQAKADFLASEKVASAILRQASHEAQIIQEDAREDYLNRVAASKHIAPVVTPEGAAKLVDLAITTPVPALTSAAA